jgi:hypothetical protein
MNREGETYEAVCVLTVGNPAQALFAKALLESSGIASEIRNEFLFNARGGVAMGPESLPQLWVDAHDADAALEVLRQAEPAPEPWTCPKCGTVLEGQFSTCWSCGTDRSLPDGTAR